MANENESSALIEIAEHAILAGKTVRMLAGGWSMFPFFRPGDQLTIVPVNLQEVTKGELVVFRRQGRWIAHRVVGTQKNDGEKILLTCGDGCLFADEPVSQAIFVGHVVGMTRGDHYESIVISALYHRLMRFFGPLLRPIFWLIKKVLLRLKLLK
jgi:signal peptidase I